jgi:hypothetical protein
MHLAEVLTPGKSAFDPLSLWININ